MKRKAYEREMRKLQIQLCKLQDWVKEKGLRVVIVFEGRDAAGKGGTIKALTEKVSPRVFRVMSPLLRAAILAAFVQRICARRRITDNG